VSFALIALGAGVEGAMLGLTLSSVAACVAAAVLLRRTGLAVEAPVDVAIGRAFSHHVQDNGKRFVVDNAAVHIGLETAAWYRAFNCLHAETNHTIEFTPLCF
jgi:protein-disulfide isomerase-like protein with CxxC motif